MEVVNSGGVALTDCIWSLVLSNIACLGRVVTSTKGNKVKNVGYCIASGESGWVMSSIHFAFHAWNVKLHQLSPLKPYLRWHVLDRGAGNTSGMKKFYPVLIMIQLMTVNLRVVTQSQVIPNATGVTIQSQTTRIQTRKVAEEEMGDVVFETTENGLVPHSAWAGCSSHFLLEDLPNLRKRNPMIQEITNRLWYICQD